MQAAIPGLLLRVGLLTQVTGARAKACQIRVDASTVTDPAKFEEYQDAQNALTGALGRLLVTVERYPDLKSNRISSHFNRECCYFVNAAQGFLKRGAAKRSSGRPESSRDNSFSKDRLQRPV